MAGNAWAGRLAGIGAVVGFGVAELDLVASPLGFLGNQQVKVVSVLVSLAFILAHGITCYAVEERQLVGADDDLGSRRAIPGLRSTVRGP